MTCLILSSVENFLQYTRVNKRGARIIVQVCVSVNKYLAVYFATVLAEVIGSHKKILTVSGEGTGGIDTVWCSKPNCSFCIKCS
jgi:hypothetical protein